MRNAIFLMLLISIISAFEIPLDAQKKTYAYGQIDTQATCFITSQNEKQCYAYVYIAPQMLQLTKRAIVKNDVKFTYGNQFAPKIYRVNETIQRMETKKRCVGVDSDGKCVYTTAQVMRTYTYLPTLIEVQDVSKDGAYIIETTHGLFEENAYNFTNFLDPIISSCGTTITTSGTYTLDRNLNCDGIGITIAANNIVLDCAGYSIRHGKNGNGNAYGVMASERRNITIRNCNIIQDGDPNSMYDAESHSIYFEWVNHSRIINTTIRTQSPRCDGINILGWYYGGTNITIENVSVQTNHSYSYGIHAFEFTNITIRNATINASSKALYFENAHHTYAETITANTTIYFDNAQNNTFNRSSMRTAELHGDSDGNVFEDVAFNNSVSIQFVQEAPGEEPGNVLFRNVSGLNVSNLFFDCMVNRCNYTIQWFVRLNITDPDGAPIGGATANYTNNQSRTGFWQDTDANGLTDWRILNDTLYHFGGNIPFNNHTIYAEKNGFVPTAISRFINSSQTIPITLEPMDNYIPCGKSIQESTTMGRNMSCSGTAIVINASGIVFDCAGYEIVFSNTESGNGIMIQNKSNITIKNCIIKQTSAIDNSHGIYVFQSSDIRIMNTTIRSNALNGSGIMFNTVNTSRITSTTVIMNNTSTHALRLIATNKSNVSSSILNHSGAQGCGAYFSRSSDNMLTYCVINSVSASTPHLCFVGSTVPGSSNNLISNTTLLGQAVNQTTITLSGNNVMLNITNLNKSGISFTDGSANTWNMTIQWYVRLNITDNTSKPLQNAQGNYTNNQTFTGNFGLSNQYGLTSWAIINDTMLRGLTPLNYNNHTIMVSKTYYDTNITITNITDNMNINIILISSAKTPPVVLLRYPKQFDVVYARDAPFWCEAYDNVSVANITVCVYYQNRSLKECKTQQGSGNFTYNQTIRLANGNYEWNCTATNVGGLNSSNTTTYYFQVYAVKEPTGGGAGGIIYIYILFVIITVVAVGYWVYREAKDNVRNGEKNK